MSFGGGFFGSGEKTIKTTNTTTNDVDNISVDSKGHVNVNNVGAIETDGDVSFNTTDLGAIAKAFEFADSTLQLASESASPSANTINTIGKNTAMIAAIIALAYLIKAKLT